MRVAIIGAGPAGLFIGSALAGRGHEVIAVDRDTGPPTEGRWRRPGVMQFHHAHAFRVQVGWALRDEWPDALDAWLALERPSRPVGARFVEHDQPIAARVALPVQADDAAEPCHALELLVREQLEASVVCNLAAQPGFTP